MDFDDRLDELQHQFWLYLVVAGSFAPLTLGVAFLASLRLQRGIARPIQQLTAKTRAISPPCAIAPDTSGWLDAPALDVANAKLRALAIDLVRLEATEKRRLAGELQDSPIARGDRRVAYAPVRAESADPAPEGPDGCARMARHQHPGALGHRDVL